MIGRGAPVVGYFLFIPRVLFPSSLLSFTLLLNYFLRRRVEEWEKVRRTGILFADIREFWRTKADGLRAYQLRVVMTAYFSTSFFDDW